METTSKSVYKDYQNNIKAPMERLFRQDVPAIKISVCLYVRGVFGEEEMDRKVRWLIDQFLPKRKDKLSIHNASFQVKPQKGSFLWMGRMILPAEFRAKLFKTVAYLQEKENGCEVLHLSVLPIVLQAPISSCKKEFSVK